MPAVQAEPQPLYIDRFMTGLYTQRSPVVTPFSFLGLQRLDRFDALWDGSNVELSSVLTLQRRPGFVKYCSAALGAGEIPRRFYAFRNLDGVIRLMADLTTEVAQVTTSAHTQVKPISGPNKASFQTVGNLLYFTVDGVLYAWNGTDAAYKACITAPLDAPVVRSVALNPYSAWVANTYYFPWAILVDSNNNIQELTTNGTTGSSEPVWNTGLGLTTTDGTAIWTNRGSSARQNSTAYAVGAFICVTFNETIDISDPAWTADVPAGFGRRRLPRVPPKIPYVVSRTYLYRCTTAGTTGSSAPSWNSGAVQDGTVVWTYASGTKVIWSSIGAASLVSKDQTICANAFLEKIIRPGKSGAAMPVVWQSTQFTFSPGFKTSEGAGGNGAQWQCTGSFDTTTSATTAAWLYGYCVKRSSDGHLSTMSPRSISIVPTVNSYVSVSGNGDITEGDKIEIYRTKQGGSTLYLLDEIANAANWQYSDTLIADEFLNTDVTAPIDGINDSLPNGATLLAFHAGYLWAAVGHVLHYNSGGDTINGVPESAWSPYNTFTFPGEIKAILPITTGLLVSSGPNIYIILGTDKTTFYPDIYLAGYGVSSADCMVTDGEIVYLYTAKRQLWAVSNNLSEIGFSIGDTLNTSFDPATSCMAPHRSGSQDSAVFISDSAGHFLRYSLATNSWSPLATVAGGCKTIASIETTDGVVDLLLGRQTAAGYVLKRSLSTFSDDATPYSAYAIFGGIGLAPLSQTLSVASILARHNNVGTLPAVSVRLNETSGSFTDLPSPVDDPPELATSTTLFSKRHDLKAAISPLPEKVQFMFIRIDYAVEAVKNELYGLGIQFEQ